MKINKLLQTAYSQCYKINSQRRRNSYHPYYQINANKSQTDKLKFFNRNIGYNPQYLPCENMSDNELWAAFTYINHEYSIITLDNWNAWRPLNSNAPITFVNLYNKEFGDITRNLFKILNLKYPDNLRNFELYIGTKLHHSITNRLKIYMQTQYTLQTAAINIQHKFREYRKNYNHIINSTSTIKFALTLKLKTRIIKHMELLNKQIKFSETADAIQKFSETELYYNSIYNPIYNSIINNPITNATTENLKQILAHGITTSNLLCNDLAMTLAILIRADNHLTIEIKQNTHVCKVGGHVMCCIGEPNDPNSIIIDPWIRYLNLYPTTGYRDITVLHKAPNRIGFIGTVAQYKSFLQAHPNKYVPRNSDLTITIHPQFSENTKSISPSDIRLDSMLL